LLIMRAGASVLELINRPYADAEYKFPFWKMANAAGLRYFAQFCEVVNPEAVKLMRAGAEKEDETNFLVNQNVVVDIAQLKLSVQKMLGEK
jgi:hypothetical protein